MRIIFSFLRLVGSHLDDQMEAERTRLGAVQLIPKLNRPSLTFRQSIRTVCHVPFVVLHSTTSPPFLAD